MEKTFMARKMEKVSPSQKQRFTGCGKNAAGGTPAGAGARARSAYGYTGARGEGAAKVTVGEAKR